MRVTIITDRQRILRLRPADEPKNVSFKGSIIDSTGFQVISFNTYAEKFTRFKPDMAGKLT